MSQTVETTFSCPAQCTVVEVSGRVERIVFCRMGAKAPCLIAAAEDLLSLGVSVGCQPDDYTREYANDNSPLLPPNEGEACPCGEHASGTEISGDDETRCEPQVADWEPDDPINAVSDAVGGELDISLHK